jgi:hypothetical protein
MRDKVLFYQDSNLYVKEPSSGFFVVRKKIILPPPNLQRGLIALFKAEDNTLDSTGNYSVVDTNNLSYNNGIVGRTFTFSPGATSYGMMTDIPPDYWEGRKPWTVSCWVRMSLPTATGSGMNMSLIISGYKNFTFSPVPFLNLLGFEADSNLSTGVIYGYRFLLGRGSSWGYSGKNIYNNWQWHHVLYGYDGSNFRAVINGGDDGLSIADPTSRQRSGDSRDSLHFVQTSRLSGWTVQIDQTYIYDRWLASNEISALYNGGNGI